MGSMGLAERGGNEQGRAPGQPGVRWHGTDTAPPQTNPATFSASLRDLAPALYDFLHRLSGRAEAANALIRQVASQAAMNAGSASQWPSVRAWLFARAYAALPMERAAASADPAAYIATDPALLPPATAESGVEEMARAVWRAISALPVEQHALVHLHTREAMVVGEAASVLGVTEREASDRLQQLLPAVEAASRALFLIRYGRSRDPDLDALLNRMSITRLTPEARTRIEEYAEQSPRAQELLRAAPPPLTVYAALRPLAPLAAVVEEAVAAALPWLYVVAPPAPPPASLTTAIQAEMPANGGYGAGETTTVNPAATPWDGTQTIPQGYGYGEAPYGLPPPTNPAAAEWSGTKMLDIPVRQRVVQEEAVYTPPRPRARRGVGPLALLGVLGGALVLVVGALVLFLVKGDGGAGNVAVTATVGGTAASVTTTAPGSPTRAIAPALQTATALAGTIGTPTPQPTVTTAPRPPSAGTETAAAGSVEATAALTPTPIGTAVSIPTVPTVPSTAVIPTPAPRVTQIPLESPTPRVTPAPTLARTATKPATIPTTAPTAAPTAAATATAPRATTAAATAVPTVAASVTAPRGGTIAVDKGSINLGASGNSAAVTLSNKGPAASPYSAKANTTWLAVSPASGSIPAGGTIPTTISVDRSGLKAGQTYSGTITFTTASGASSTVTVTITT